MKIAKITFREKRRYMGKNEIGFSSIRGGNVVGNILSIFYGWRDTVNTYS